MGLSAVVVLITADVLTTRLNFTLPLCLLGQVWTDIERGNLLIHWHDPAVVPQSIGGLGRYPIIKQWWWIVRVEGSPAYDVLISLPLWWLWSFLLIPTASLWWFDRRLPGHCPNCRYKLAGLPAAAACPECGSLPHFPR